VKLEDVAVASAEVPAVAGPVVGVGVAFGLEGPGVLEAGQVALDGAFGDAEGVGELTDGEGARDPASVGQP
jgi:hypothetical protein